MEDTEMKALLVHRSFPGQFLHLVRELASSGHQVVFITEPTANHIPGVTKVSYTVTPASHRTHPAAQDFDAAQRRAQAVAEVAAGLRSADFTPDIIIGHEAWGETLNLAEIWPHVPAITYREYFYHPAGADVGFDPEFPVTPADYPRVRAKNASSLLSLHAGGQGVTPTVWQRSLYPAWAQPSIAVVPDGVDLDTCRPDPAVRQSPFDLAGLQIQPHHRLVTYVARDLEPYRGFHTLIRALPRVMERPDVHVICLGGDGVSYGLAPPQGTWRQRLLASLGPSLDATRLHFPGHVGYADFVRLLQRSDVHAYLSYPFIASWSLREAMACGCSLVAGNTAPVRELIDDGTHGILVPCLEPAAVADGILALLADAQRRQALGAAARARAEREMALPDHLATWLQLIKLTSGRRVGPR
jgi:glycosyltransferase involved in cell wall biosynthesis